MLLEKCYCIISRYFIIAWGHIIASFTVFQIVTYKKNIFCTNRASESPQTVILPLSTISH